MNRVASLHLKRSLSVVLAAAFVLTPATAPLLAQAKKPAAAKPDKATQGKARAAFALGNEKMEAGEFDAAAAAFKEANELIPAALAQYKYALALDKAGKPKEALEAYKALLAGELPEKMAEQKIAAEKRVAELTEGLKPKTGVVKLTSNPPGATVVVDGERSLDVTPTTLTLKPGVHHVEVTMAGHEAVKKDVEVAAGASVELAIDLPAAAPPPPVASSSAPPPPPPPPPPATTEPTGPKSKTPAYVTIGVAGGAAIVGTFFGVKALSAKSDFKDHPTQDAADRTQKNALIADVAFGVALTLGVTGTVLLLTGGKSEKGKLELAPIVGKTTQGAALKLAF